MTTPVTLADGSTYPYGFGLNVSGEGDNQVISHGGRLCGFQSALVHYARGNITIAVLITLLSAGMAAQAVFFLARANW